MEKLTIYIANDGTKFADEKICLEYEEEKAKYPDDPGVRFYNIIGDEIDISNISQVAYYNVTNSIIANAKYRSIRMQRIIQRVPMPTDVGCYATSGKGTFKLDSELFEEIMARLHHK